MPKAQFGEDNGNAKLTDREVELLIAAFGDLVLVHPPRSKARIYRVLSPRFGVSVRAVKAICTGERRAQVDPPRDRW